MEEADAIILLSLRQLGCPLDANVTSLAQLKTEQLVLCTARVLNAINPEFEIPSGSIMELPKATVFRVCSNLALAIKVRLSIALGIFEIFLLSQKLGYNGDLGYHSFLYPNEADVRTMFSFLMEKMPKNEGGEPAEGIFEGRQH